MLDISKVKKKSFGGKNFWLLIVDDYLDMNWSFFLRHKSETARVVLKFIKKLMNEEGINVEIIRCDNAGENYKLKEVLENENMGIKFEFTAVDTPQQNGKVERKFATLYGRVRSALNQAKLKPFLRFGLWAECAKTMTEQENLIVKKKDAKPAYELFYGREAKIARYLRTFGEIGIVKNIQKLKGKLEDRGRALIFVGYSDDHNKDVYRMFN